LLLCLSAAAFAGGKEEESQTILNTEWVLCITSFDVSGLSPSRQSLREVFTRSLAASLNQVNNHTRSPEEYTYYEDYAWSKDRQTAAKNLASKREERDRLVFRGDAKRVYQKALKTADEAIKKLEEELAKINSTRPVIEGRPVFKFTEGNIGGNFPAPPVSGGEYRFCTREKADAFLAGTVSEIHGRIYLELKLYTVYSRSYVYEDFAVFSLEDNQAAVNELGERLVAAVSGNGSAPLIVKGEPQGAAVLLDGSFAGRVDTGIIEYAPGEVEVDIYAENYTPFTMPLELNAGEITELYINLSPEALAYLTIDVPGKEGTRLYWGALYMGETPLSLSLARGGDYIYMESPGGDTAGVVVEIGSPAETEEKLNLKTVLPPSEYEDRINLARSKMYGAYGRAWIALPLAFLLGGIADSLIQTYNYQYDPALYDTALAGYYVRIGAWTLVGLAAGEYIYRIYRYLKTVGEKAPLVVKR
jgi:hypothetical protein